MVSSEKRSHDRRLVKLMRVHMTFFGRLRLLRMCKVAERECKKVQDESAYECLFERRVRVWVRLWKTGLSYLLSTHVNPWGATIDKKKLAFSSDNFYPFAF